MRNLYLVLLCFMAFASNAQFTLYQTGNSPIPSNYLNAVALATDGSVWVGSANGLAHYDGSNWDVYQTANSGIPANDIRSLRPTNNGNLWLGTYGGGASLFDGTNWTTYTPQNSGLPDTNVRGICVDSLNRVWFCTNYGFARFDQQNWLEYNMSNYPGVIQTNNFTSVEMDSSGHAWVGSINGGIFDVIDTSVTNYWNHNSQIADNTIFNLQIDADQNKWLPMPVGGMNVFTPQGNFIKINMFQYPDLPVNSYYDVIFINSIPVFGSNMGGLVVFDAANGIRTFDSQNSNLPDDIIRDLAYDAATETLWVATESGGLASIGWSTLAGIEASKTALDQIKLYPNPLTNDILTVETSVQAPYRILSLTGQVMATGMTAYGKTEIQTTGLPRGIYMLDIPGVPASRFVKL